MQHPSCWRRFSLKPNHSPADLDRPAKPLKLQECWKLHGHGLCVFQDTWDEDHKVVQCLASSSAALGNWNQWNLRWQQQTWYLCDRRHPAVKAKPNTLFSLYGSLNSTMSGDLLNDAIVCLLLPDSRNRDLRTLLHWILQPCYRFPPGNCTAIGLSILSPFSDEAPVQTVRFCISVFPGILFINYMAQKCPAGWVTCSSSLSTTLTILKEIRQFLNAKDYFIPHKTTHKKDFKLVSYLYLHPP